MKPSRLLEIRTGLANPALCPSLECIVVNRKRTLILVGTSLCLIAILWFAFRGPSAPPRTFPSPNGYTDLVRASTLLTGTPPARTNSIEELESYVRANQAALETARRGLSHESRVTTDYGQAYLTLHMDELGGLKAVARLFRVEAQLAERQNRTEDAALAYCDIVELGRASCRGGLLIDALVGIAIEDLGLNGLKELQPNLSPATATAALERLRKVQATAEPFEEILKQERLWAQNAPSLAERFAGAIMRITRPSAFKSATQGARSNWAAVETRRRTLMRAFAEIGQPGAPGAPPDPAQPELGIK